MQNFPRQLAMQSCALCFYVRCGSFNQIKKNCHRNIAAYFCLYGHKNDTITEVKSTLLKKKLQSGEVLVKYFQQVPTIISLPPPDEMIQMIAATFETLVIDGTKPAIYVTNSLDGSDDNMVSRRLL